MLSRIYENGTVEVQPTFARSVRSWVARGEIMSVAIPEHLQAVDGFEATLFQRFGIALETLKHANGAGVMTFILKRKALLNVLLVYEELVDYIQNIHIERCVSLKQSESARSKAKNTLFSTISPNGTDRKKLKRMFDYHAKCATPYYRFYQPYGNDGILAMIPPKIREGDMHRSPAVFTIFLEVLDVVRQEFHDTRLGFFSSLIAGLALNRVPSERMMEELGRWTSPDAISSFNVNADISSVSDVTSKTNSCDDLCYESIYKSEADK